VGAISDYVWAPSIHTISCPLFTIHSTFQIKVAGASGNDVKYN